MGGKATRKRTGIPVFTDGEVGHHACDSSGSTQGPLVLAAIILSGGRYFIKAVLVNGPTTKDNLNGNKDLSLAGLSVSKFISSSDKFTVSYTARYTEEVMFDI